MSLREQIEKALSEPFDAAAQGLDETEYKGLGVWHNAPTLEESWVKISRELNLESGTFEGGVWKPSPNWDAPTDIDILDETGVKGTGKGEIKDVTNLKKKFNALKEHLPPGEYGMNADHPTKARMYQRTWLNDPDFRLSGIMARGKISPEEAAKLTKKGIPLKFETMVMTIPKKPEGSKRGSYIKNPMSFDERVAFGAEYEANLKESLESGLQQMKPGGAQIDYNGELYTVIPNKGSKSGYNFKRVTDLNEVARIRNIKKAEKFISLEDRIDGMRQIFKSEYPGSVIPDDEIVKLATEIQEFNETDVKLKGGYAARVGKDIDDRFPISGEGGYFSTHQLEPEDRVFNQHTKRHLFPKHPIDEAGTHYGNFKQIGMTKLEQIKYDLSSPLYKGKRITANIDGKMLRRALFGTVSGVAANFASPLKSLAAIPDVIPITYAFDALSLGTTQLDKWATKQLPDDHVYESGATKQQALDFLNKQTAADVVGLEPTGVGNIPAVIHQQTDPRETEEQKRERSEQAIQNVRTMQQHGMTPWF